MMGFLLCPLVAVFPLGEPGLLTLQMPEETESTHSKSGSLGLMVSWVTPFISGFPDPCILPIRNTAQMMDIDLGCTLGFEEWCPILAHYYFQAGVLAVVTRSCYITLSGQQFLGGIVYNVINLFHGHGPTVAPPLLFKAMLCRIPCWQNKHCVTHWTVILAKVLWSEKANPYIECSSRN